MAIEFFHHLIGQSPEAYYFIEESDPLDAAEIYTKLEKFQNKILLIGYTYPGDGHAIAIYVHPEHPMVLDPADGLERYDNLETLSSYWGSKLRGKKIQTVAVFSPTH